MLSWYIPWSKTDRKAQCCWRKQYACHFTSSMTLCKIFLSSIFVAIDNRFLKRFIFTNFVREYIIISLFFFLFFLHCKCLTIHSKRPCTLARRIILGLKQFVYLKFETRSNGVASKTTLMQYNYSSFIFFQQLVPNLKVGAYVKLASGSGGSRTSAAVSEMRLVLQFFLIARAGGACCSRTHESRRSWLLNRCDPPLHPTPNKFPLCQTTTSSL